MNKILFISATLLCFFVGNVYAQNTADRIPCTLTDDFESGELFGWEQYPYAEDIGSNRLFFNHTSPTFKNSHYALATLVRANDAVELYHGFTKRINIWTTNASRVHVALYFQSDRNPGILEISLGTFDGRQFIDTIHNPVANQWIELDIPIKDFRLKGISLMPNEHVQVVTLEGSYPMVYWLNTYTMLMDDFTINGERERHFIGVNPVSTDLNMFNISILDKHFFYGDNISLAAVPEGKIALKEVRGVLTDGKGKLLKSNIPFNLEKGEWINRSIYQIKNEDATGQWEIQLTGQTSLGTEVKWGFKFLMPGKKITGYPRLFFSGEELQSRLTNEKSVVAKRILSHALENTQFLRVNIDSIREGEDKTSENLVGGPYAKYSAGSDAAGAWLNPMKALQDVIQDGSFRYAFIRDTIAGEQAKKALLKLCSFNKWNNNWMLERKFWTYYPVGFVLTSVAYGYDMLHDLLTDQERKLVRNAILDKGLKLFNRDMVEMNRMPSNITNHIAVLVSGTLLAATAIYGEDPSNPYMEPFLSGIITKAKTFMDRTYHEDGSYAEPKTGYMNMATRAIVELLAVLERNFGVDYSTTTNVQNFYKYPLQATDSSGLMQDFGDGNSSFKAFTEIHSEWFVHRLGNPFLYQYVKPYWEAGNGGYMGYLWFRDDIKPKQRETLPASKIFKEQGMVMRSGWEEGSTVISTRVGPHGNHGHFDQGSFQIMANGEQLLIDAGIGAGGYYKNLEYLVYNVQAIAHNVMLVDHDPESQAPAHFKNDIAALQNWPQVVSSFSGTLADAFEFELASVYKDKLETYTRTLLYTKTGPLFLFDKVKSKSPEGHTYNWIFHGPQKGLLNALPNYTGWFDKKDAGTIKNKTGNERGEMNESTFNYKAPRLTINRADARLTLDVVSPVIESSSITDKPTESYLTLNSKPKLREANFLAVIMPETKPTAGNYPASFITTRVALPGWIGAKAKNDELLDVCFFRTNSAKNIDRVEGFTTDASKFSASYKNNILVKAFFEGSSFSTGDSYFKSNKPVVCAFSSVGSGTAIEIKNTGTTELVFYLPHPPSDVRLNEAVINHWNYDKVKKLMTITLEPGMNIIFIK